MIFYKNVVNKGWIPFLGENKNEYDTYDRRKIDKINTTQSKNKSLR